MAIHDFRSQRLFVDSDLIAGKAFEADRNQANYLLNVLRLKEGQTILLFNGQDGEWEAEISVAGRKKCSLIPRQQTRTQTPPYALTLCFAPLKQARLDYLVQKAVEMGAGIIQPVITQHTQVRNLNAKRLHANAIEAAEQCGIISLPEIRDPIDLTALDETLLPNEPLVLCDEEAPDAQGFFDVYAGQDPRQIERMAILIGPEGGFSQQEREILHTWKRTCLLGLGPRILRADTAAIAAMAIVQSVIGDWKHENGNTV